MTSDSGIKALYRGVLVGFALAFAVGTALPGRFRDHEKRDRLSQPGGTRPGQHAALYLRRLEARRGARLEDRADRGEQRLPDRRKISTWCSR